MINYGSLMIQIQKLNEESPRVSTLHNNMAGYSIEAIKGQL